MVTLVAGVVAGAALASAHELRGLAAVALGVTVVAGALGFDLAAHWFDRALRQIDRLSADCAAARRASLTDALTGLGNRRHFDERLGEAVMAGLRYGEAFSVALFDLDDFKRVNDRAGHAAGDSVLRHVAAVLAAGTREVDIVCRWGGEEFAVLLPKTAPSDAAVAAERLIGTLRETVVDLGDGPARLTASVGVAAFPADGGDGASVLQAADAALLRAKALGKDRVQRALPEVIDLTGRERVPHANA